MQQTGSFRRTLIGIAAAVGLIVAGAGHARIAAQAPSPVIQVIASGLDNPRGLAFGTDGALYVVEAGRGGPSTLCLPDPGAGPGVMKCYGATGAVTRITGIGVQQRVVTGLPSLAQPSGDAATGPHDIDFGLGRAFITIGLGADPRARGPFEAAGIRLGSLVRVLPNGQWDYVVDISGYEITANPDGGAIDSNPYGLRVLSDRAVVTDAGGNSLLQISLNGTVSTLAVFPNRAVGPATIQEVPTSVTDGPGGDLYVGQLTGAPFPVGAARVYRVPANGGAPVPVVTGFTNIIDITVGPNGTAYVLEHDADGIIPPLGPGVNGRLI